MLLPSTIERRTVIDRNAYLCFRFVMKKILLASIAAAAIGAATSVYAADLTSRQPAYEPPPPPPPFSWTGFYLGANVGVGAGQTTWKDTAGNFLFGDIDGNNFGNTANTSQFGGVYGGQIGFNYEFAGSWVVGLEGQFSGSNIVGTNVDQFNNA
jgi:outer membrane immunogenic protein